MAALYFSGSEFGNQVPEVVYSKQPNQSQMTQTLIKEQINTIQKATEKAAKSKGSALRFLKDAGIIIQPKPTSGNSTAAKKK